MPHLRSATMPHLMSTGLYTPHWQKDVRWKRRTHPVRQLPPRASGHYLTGSHRTRPWSGSRYPRPLFVIKLESLGKLLNEDCDGTGADLVEKSFRTG